MNAKQKSQLLDAMKKDKEFKEEVITAIVSDKSLVQQLAQAVFGQPVSVVGIQSNGSIADWFLHARQTGNRP